jgi:hypothetical protein
LGRTLCRWGGLPGVTGRALVGAGQNVTCGALLLIAVGLFAGSFWYDAWRHRHERTERRDWD